MIRGSICMYTNYEYIDTSNPLLLREITLRGNCVNFAFRKHDQICIYAKFAYTQNEICTWSEAGANFPTFANVQILHTRVNAYTWPDLHTYAKFAYTCTQNLHTYANPVILIQ